MFGRYSGRLFSFFANRRGNAYVIGRTLEQRANFSVKGRPIVFARGVSGVSAGVAGSVFSVISFAACRAALVKHQTMDAAKIISEADELFEAVRYEELYDFLYKHKDENNDEILWRLARAAYRKSNSVKVKEEKERLLTDAKQYVYEALKLNDDNFASHKWASIVVVELAELHGTKAKIEQSIVSKEHMLRAHSLNPKDGTTLYLLGVWCFTFADLSWHQRKLAGLIFASPPTSSYEEALQYFQKAEEASPNFYSKNLLMLGKTLLKIKKTDVAISFLKRARDYFPKTDEDKEAKEEAKTLLHGLGIKN